MNTDHKDALIECVPNISEGQNLDLINQITDLVDKSPEVYLLHRDTGFSANRTVFTFAGRPDPVIETAFQLAKKAVDSIDLNKHRGTHPRLGAIDVIPLIPLKNISMHECVELSYNLGKKIALTFDLPVYYYENSAQSINRKLLSKIRSGEFENLSLKMHHPDWHPDVGPLNPHPTAGATVVGARDFLIAFNINLDTDRVDIAQNIAVEIRESGGIKKVKNLGIKEKGMLEGVRAIGWYVEEYGCAQVSTNITNIELVSMAQVYETVKRVATKYEIQLNGSELVGMIPKKCLINSGKYYAPDIEDHEKLMRLGVEKLGLNTVKTFLQHKQILEYVYSQKSGRDYLFY